MKRRSFGRPAAPPAAPAAQSAAPSPMTTQGGMPMMAAGANPRTANAMPKGMGMMGGGMMPANAQSGLMRLMMGGRGR